MKNVLIVVDMQNDFLLKDGKLTISSQSEDSTKQLRGDVADFMSKFDGDIICTRDIHEEDSCEFSIYPKHCIKNSKGAKLIDEIKEVGIQRNLKVYDNGNYSKGIDFGQYCHSGKDHVFSVFGVCTHISVHDVVSELVNTYKETQNKIPDVTIYKNLCGDFDQQMADFSLKRLQNLYGVKVL